MKSQGGKPLRCYRREEDGVVAKEKEVELESVVAAGEGEGSRGSWEGGGAAGRYPQKRRGEEGKENYFCSKEGGASLK